MWRGPSTLALGRNERQKKLYYIDMHTTSSNFSNTIYSVGCARAQALWALFISRHVDTLLSHSSIGSATALASCERTDIACPCARVIKASIGSASARSKSALTSSRSAGRSLRDSCKRLRAPRDARSVHAAARATHPPPRPARRRAAVGRIARALAAHIARTLAAPLSFPRRARGR